MSGSSHNAILRFDKTMGGDWVIDTKKEQNDIEAYVAQKRLEYMINMKNKFDEEMLHGWSAWGENAKIKKEYYNVYNVLEELISEEAKYLASLSPRSRLVLE